ncbi:hypothetical protein [Singulisphaera sp. GP187]|uniref:hypothetical protein n=1 Tax=Singulisphaera sp. GP187 TaxID=1882752 RepID=UPI000940D570|nr:hypothetical protein [Singulisphaera sp. GP187]
MREIERVWRSLEDAYDKGDERNPDLPKVQYEEHLQSVDRLFRTRLSDQNLCELAVSPKLPPVPEDQNTFAYAMLTFMVKELVQSGGRRCLVDLLAKRCPGRIHGSETVEFYLAFHGERLKDPILVLGEAYAKCRVPEARHALVASVRRGFAGLGIRGKDDAVFVENAMQWYKKEKGHLVVNASYPTNETVPGGISLTDSYEKDPGLFDHPSPSREPLFKKMAVPPGGPKNGGEDPGP